MKNIIKIIVLVLLAVPTLANDFTNRTLVDKGYGDINWLTVAIIFTIAVEGLALLIIAFLLYRDFPTKK